ncbi:MAG: hypothetical protein ACLQDV_10165 [Candidatus Binataceae bacterium]
MNAHRIAIAMLITLAAFAGGACTAAVGNTYDNAKDEIANLTPKDVKTKSIPTIKQITINRIAVMPIIDDPKGGQPLSPGASDAITAELYSQVAVAGGWQVIAQDDVSQALQQMPPATPATLDANALILGRMVSADGVLFGEVQRYQERVGIDDTESKPAAVTFTLKFLDMQRKQVVWTAQFAKSQKSFAQSVTSLVNFVQKEGRWVHAQEVAEVGVQEAVADLHRNLNIASDANRFETGTYGQLKSGQQRYNQGMGKAGLY